MLRSVSMEGGGRAALGTKAQVSFMWRQALAKSGTAKEPDDGSWACVCV